MGDSMREDFDAAIEDLDVAEDLSETPQEVLDPSPEIGDDSEDETALLQSEGAESSGKPSEEKGQSSASESEGAPDIKKKKGKTKKTASSGVGELPDGEKSAGEGDSLRAPLYFEPKERQEWTKIPRNLQERIIARDAEVDRTIADTNDARQLHSHFGQLAQSYAPVLAAEGVQHPMQAVESLFATVAKLRMGTPQQKAEEITRIIQQYGIDIPTLDSTLSGAPVSQNDQQTSRMEQMLEQKLAPVQQFMQTIDTLQSNQVQHGQDAATQSVKEFAGKAEFLADVREDMADIIDLSARRGVEMTLQQAYDRACSAHPQINEILTKRSDDAKLLGGQQTLDQKRLASSSLSGRQSGAGGGSSATSLRDQLEQAWNEQGEA